MTELWQYDYKEVKNAKSEEEYAAIRFRELGWHLINGFLCNFTPFILMMCLLGLIHFFGSI
jgi:hypothetical protein